MPLPFARSAVRRIFWMGGSSGKMTESSKKFVDDAIASNKVTVFSKSYCPFCVRAIAAIEKMGPSGLKVEHIENHAEMDAVQNYLQTLTGGRSVPRVFVGGKFVGGCDETMAEINNGKFADRLKEVGAK
eukprot:GDKH01020470.1.p2 GENE.GDKH01020470.1~~GDKH01020470.1.p2  ORF type:complete len:129 (-),score=15.06 GDKH01020470.1:186-572(-)